MPLHSFQGSEDGSAISADKIDVSRKPAVTTPGTPGGKKSKKKKKNAADVTPPQMINPMGGMASGISPRGLDVYSMPTTMVNQSMSLPTIKSDLNDSDPKVNQSPPLFSHIDVILCSAQTRSSAQVEDRWTHARRELHQARTHEPDDEQCSSSQRAAHQGTRSERER